MQSKSTNPNHRSRRVPEQPTEKLPARPQKYPPKTSALWPNEVRIPTRLSSWIRIHHGIHYPFTSLYCEIWRTGGRTDAAVQWLMGERCCNMRGERRGREREGRGERQPPESKSNPLWTIFGSGFETVYGKPPALMESDPVSFVMKDCWCISDQ